VEKKQ